MRHTARRSTTLRRVGVAALVAPLALSLAACGQDDEGSDAAGDSSALATSEAEETPDGESTPEGKTDEAAGNSESPAAGGTDSPVGKSTEGDSLTPEEFVDILTAAFDRATTASISMSTDVSSMSTTSTGVVDYTGKSPKLSMTMAGGPLPEDSTAEVRLVDDAIYMDSGLSGGKFVKMQLDDAAGTGVDLSTIDPSQALRSFAEAAVDVTYAGTEKIDGDTLHRYSLQLDPAKMGLGKDARQAAPKRVDYDAWFDDEGRIRQIVTTMGKAGSTTVTYSDWGKPVTIEAPPASEVMEMPKMPTSPQG